MKINSILKMADGGLKIWFSYIENEEIITVKEQYKPHEKYFLVSEGSRSVEKKPLNLGNYYRRIDDDNKVYGAVIKKIASILKVNEDVLFEEILLSDLAYELSIDENDYETIEDIPSEIIGNVSWEFEKVFKNENNI